MRHATAVSSASAGRRTLLMGRAVFADIDRVVGEHIDDRHFHEGRKPQCGAQIVGEHKEGRHEGAEPAVQRDAIGDGRHAVLADTEVNVAAGRIFLREDEGGAVGIGGQLRNVRARQIRGAADEVRPCARDCAQAFAGRVARRDFFAHFEGGQVQFVHCLAAEPRRELAGKLRICLFQASKRACHA